MNGPLIHVQGDTMDIRFDRFGLDEYKTFLKTKKVPEFRIVFDPKTETYRIEAPARFASLMGVAAPAASRADLEMPVQMFDYQRDITSTALKAKRWASWWDCGLGKTIHQLEFARQVVNRTGQRVLIIAPPNVVPQTVEMAQEFYGESYAIRSIKTREDMARWCAGEHDNGAPGMVGITNYEKMIPGVMNELRHLGGLVLDESSILKTGGGVIKWNLIKSAKGIEYKLSCTATPAPNDIMEYASQASFLEKLRNEGDILWTYFARDKRGNWKVKPHARGAFYRFMASWSIYLRHPAAYGWQDNSRQIPDPHIFQHPIPLTSAQADLLRTYAAPTGELFVSERQGITKRSKLSQIAKGFIYLDGKKNIARVDSKKPAFVADLIAQEARAGLQVLVWTIFDEESAILSEELARLGVTHDVLSGAVREKDRGEMLERFRHGETPVLVSKASLLGYGMNFQHCGSMVFNGWNDSYEQWYQAIRRAVRYGQTRAVRVHVPLVPDLEGAQLENVFRKAANWERDTAEMERFYLEALREGIAA